MQKELFNMFGNGHRENIIFSIDAGESVTCHFKASGSDTATDKYFNLGSEAKKVAISTTDTATITHICGQELKFPKTIPTGGIVFKEGIEWGKIIIRAISDATTIEIYAS